MTTEDVLTVHRNVFLAALLNRDFEALSMLYSNDYVLVRQDGTVFTKDEILRDLRENDLIFKSIEISGEVVRVYDDIGILTGESRTVAERLGVSSSAHFRFIAVYVRTGDSLNLIHFQSTSSAEKAPC
jgi:ketosteroid isomerase-like protein